MGNQGFFQNWIVRNILGALAFVLGLSLVITVVLSVITQHGKEIPVPDFSNMTVSEAMAAARQSGVRIEVTDSVYVRRIKKGVVYSQNPKAGSHVKEGRRILVTINAKQSRKLSMPSLIGLSMRQAKAELTSKGFKLGRLIYVSDIATNNVIGQTYRGADIAAGTMLEMGSAVNLIVGLNEEDGVTFVPDLSGKTASWAVDALHENSLNLSSLRYDSTVKTYADSLAAKVYRQVPAADQAKVRMGTEVSLMLTMDESRIPARQSAGTE